MRRLTSVFFILLLLVLASGACVEVSEMDSRPTLKTPVAVNDLFLGAEHDLAILAIEFLPPLESLHGLSGETSVTLQLAIENRGYGKETNIPVAAVLSCEGRTLIQQNDTIESLAAGEIKIVEFVGALSSPLSAEYHLEVSVGLVADEAHVSNNSSIYNIRVTGSNE